MSYGYREERRRLKELERQKREQDKLNLREQARTEVDDSIQKFEALVSFHKQCCPIVKWTDLASEFSPLEIVKQPYVERQKWRDTRISEPKDNIPPPLPLRTEITQSSQQSIQYQTWEKRKKLAKHVLAREVSAYPEALKEYSSLDEVISAESDIALGMHSWSKIEMHVKLNGSDSIPAESKSLTSSGKISIKKIPASRFHEIHQDHVCSVILRIAREIFAVIPIEALLLTASVPLFDTSRGNTSIVPIYSVLIKKADLSGMNFDKIDPSDAIENLLHRGDFKSSRKTGAFQPVVPLKFNEIYATTSHKTNLPDLIKTAETLKSTLSRLVNADVENTI